MKQINGLIALMMLLVSTQVSFSQSKTLRGQITASSDLDGIHILNISAQKFTVTDDKGGFEIPARLQDTIYISSIQYTPQSIVVSQANLDLEFIAITLNDRVNELDEVIVGKVLTGDLLLDIENSDAKRDINFYDLGIPGYTGKPKTQRERRLYEADAGKAIVIAPLFVGINIHKILNKISGRTKKLKRAVLLEQHQTCMTAMKSEFSKLLFGSYQIEDHLKDAFFYFITEDPDFMGYCKANNSLETYQWLLKKLYSYTDDDTESKD